MPAYLGGHAAADSIKAAEYTPGPRDVVELIADLVPAVDRVQALETTRVLSGE